MFSAFHSLTGLKLIVTICIAIRICYGLKCNMGVSHKNSPAVDGAGELMEVQCSSKHFHQLEQANDLLNDEQSLPTDFNISYSHGAADGSSDEVTNCFIFYNAIKDKADFACDYDNICSDAQQTKQTSVCHKGGRGSLFCCQGDLCNTKSYIQHLSPPQAATICYNGTNSGVNSVDISETRCKSSWCYQSATYMENNRLLEQKFGCDAECDELEFELSESTCRQKFLHGGMTQRICYCATDRCNSVVTRIAPGSADTEPGHFPATVPPYLKMHNPEYDQDRPHGHMMKRRWMMLGGCIGTAVFGLLLISLLAVVIHRCRRQRARKVSFSYSQLEDDTAEPINDEKMIVT